MKLTIWVGCAAVLGFILGAVLASRRVKAVELPAPSTALLSELALPGAREPVRLPLPKAQLERLTRETAAITQDSAAFRADLEAMQQHYRARLEALLNNTQLETLRRAPTVTAGPVKIASGPPTPEGDVLMVSPLPVGEAEATPALPPEMLQSILELTFVSWSLENLRAELDLSADQTRQVRELLAERRTRFLELVDRRPPPTLRLLNLGRELRQLKVDPRP
jgi:hypothetical protein